MPKDQGTETCDKDSLYSAPSIRNSVVKLKLDVPRDQDTETCDTNSLCSASSFNNEPLASIFETRNYRNSYCP